MAWYWWVLIVYLVLNSQKQQGVSQTQSTSGNPAYSGGFGINLIF